MDISDSKINKRNIQQKMKISKKIKDYLIIIKKFLCGARVNPRAKVSLCAHLTPTLTPYVFNTYLKQFFICYYNSKKLQKNVPYLYLFQTLFYQFNFS